MNGELIRENVMIVLLHVLIFIRSYIWNLLVNWTMKGIDRMKPRNHVTRLDGSLERKESV